MNQIYAGLFLFGTIFFSCSYDRAEIANFTIEVPVGFPKITFLDENQPTMERIMLGRKLFFDPVLSRDSSISCASCHRPEKLFADDKPTTPGIEGRAGTRNVPSLANVAYHSSLLREGSIPNLEGQVGVPIQEANEFDHNMVVIIEKLRSDPEYQRLSKNAYAREMDPWVLTRSIALFQRTLISGNSPYDRFKYCHENSALTEAEKRGMELFISEELACIKCHGDVLLGGQQFHNNGLYDNYIDPGRYRFTQEESDRGVFKVPSLRNVALTPPYMHDGSISTLEEVIRHYASGGSDHPNKSNLINGFPLNEQEAKDLISFLHSLTDPHFVEYCYNHF